jgi:alkanesulfonate monooxygenase SsuD/methylene tetrahydromethanopterin reductase-like flavin-dependent oxidoreductase (luciferase family)
VADVLQHLLEEGGGNGFQITPAWYAPDYYRDIVDLLVPELQKRGCFRKKYSGRNLLRDRLGVA